MDAAQIAAMIADREAGTPGPWRIDATRSKSGTYAKISGKGWFSFAKVVVQMKQCLHETAVGLANARRIARVPDMEAHIIDQAAELERMRAALTEIAACLDGSPDYHTQGMGCGLEDRCITDRYDAMQYGWDAAIDRVYSEHVSGALEVAHAALKGGTQ